MSTIRQVVSRLRADLREVNADSIYTNRHLYDAFWTAGLLLIQRENDAQKLRNIRNFKEYNFSTEEVDILEDSCVPYECVACRVKIPKPIYSKLGFIYRFIGTPDQSISFNLVTPFEFANKLKMRGNKAKYAYLSGDYLYLSHCYPCIKIIGLFNTKSDKKGGCSIMDSEVEVPDYLIENALRMAKENIAPFIGKSHDHVANKNTQS